MEADCVDQDWYGRGKVIRITAMCDQAPEDDKDDSRTSFAPPAEAAAEWNARFGVRG